MKCSWFVIAALIILGNFDQIQAMGRGKQKNKYKQGELSKSYSEVVMGTGVISHPLIIKLQKDQEEIDLAETEKDKIDSKKEIALGALVLIEQHRKNKEIDKQTRKDLVKLKEPFKKFLKMNNIDANGLDYESDEEKNLHDRVRIKYTLKQNNLKTIQSLENDKTYLNNKTKELDMQIAALNKQLMELTTQRDKNNGEIQHKESLIITIKTSNELLDQRMLDNKSAAEKISKDLTEKLRKLKENLTTVQQQKVNDDQESAKQFASTCLQLSQEISNIEPQAKQAIDELEKIKNKIETGHSDPKSWGSYFWRNSTSN